MKMNKADRLVIRTTRFPIFNENIGSFEEAHGKHRVVLVPTDDRYIVPLLA